MDEALIRKQEEELQHTGRYYKHICFLCVPLLFVSCYLYGLRPLLLCGFAVLMGNLCDRLISLLRRRVYQAGDYSNESFALVIALLMPATVDWYVLAAAIVAGVLIGKEVFGGYGSYPFHPAAVGYAVADGLHLVQRADDAVLRVVGHQRGIRIVQQQAGEVESLLKLSIGYKFRCEAGIRLPKGCRIELHHRHDQSPVPSKGVVFASFRPDSTSTGSRPCRSSARSSAASSASALRACAKIRPFLNSSMCGP